MLQAQRDPRARPLTHGRLELCHARPSCIEPALIQLFTKLEVPTSTAAWGSAAQVFDVLDAELQKGPWILGDQFSAADIAIGAGLNFAVRVFKMVPPRPSFCCVRGISEGFRHVSSGTAMCPIPVSR